LKSLKHNQNNLKQHYLVLFDKGKRKIYTGEVYEVYKPLCHKADLRPLTQRRISDIIVELDMLGIISAKTISKGRYGRTREISLELSKTLKDKTRTILTDILALR